MSIISGKTPQNREMTSSSYAPVILLGCRNQPVVIHFVYDSIKPSE